MRRVGAGSIVDRLVRLHAARLTDDERSRLLGRLAVYVDTARLADYERSRLLGRLSVVVDDETWQAALDAVMRDRADG